MRKLAALFDEVKETIASQPSVATASANIGAADLTSKPAWQKFLISQGIPSASAI
jgi:hypothetical protein